VIRSFSRIVALAAIVTIARPIAASADPPAYDDAGMHFTAPADFEKVDLPAPADPTGSDDSDGPTPVAAFTYHRGRTDQRVITILVARFDGLVDQFDTAHAAEERKGGDTFIVENKKTTLANGMPAYYLKVSAGATAGQFTERYEYLVCDGTRSIIVQYSGAAGLDANVAKAALSTLYVVVYPKHRP